ncbi:hypothetical protein SAMN04488137_1372 [Fictibacillus solisalsi]|uniref:Small, acid-soluble spore protein N n=1 Tax=Fictibacillus solisalsi TaxID=459525 RepID=A0A1G9V5C1_9BACL|nr:hypothetical protein [Fictibacillus solisalsi]SDM67404.1 hypothetical protein SAMN04488137_1372 [Fictibacillus solisalsi]
MPYHKDKQQAFQDAEKGYSQAVEAHQLIQSDAADYGTRVKELRKEAEEALQQIDNALEVSSEHQRQQLEQYRDELKGYINQYPN